MVVVVKSLHCENSLLRLSHKRPLRLHSLAQKEAGHLLNPTHEKNRILIFLRFNLRRKSKVDDLHVNENQDRGALKAVYHISFMPNHYTSAGFQCHAIQNRSK